jgi:hypothetical protein
LAKKRRFGFKLKPFSQEKMIIALAFNIHNRHFFSPKIGQNRLICIMIITLT